MNFNLWMPFSGTGSGRLYDEYRIRSSYAAALNEGYLFSDKDSFPDSEEKINFIKKYTEEYLRVRPYMSEDFFPLTVSSGSPDIWCAMQFNRPDENDGIVEVFRRENSPYETAVFPLYGLNTEKNYLFSDADGGCFTLNGKELVKKGLQLNIQKKESAKIFFYSVTD